MEFDYSPKVKDMQARLLAFMDEHIYPNEAALLPGVAANRAKGNAWIADHAASSRSSSPRPAPQGLWNLFLPESPSARPRACPTWNTRRCARSWAACPGPRGVQLLGARHRQHGDLERYGTPEQKEQWLEPLLRGEIRSAFLMTEPAVASSDATNIQCRIRRDGDHYVINGRKWWSSGAGDPRCKDLIVMGKTDPDAPAPLAAVHDPGAARHARRHVIVRPLTVFGYDDAPHGHMECVLENVRVPAGQHPAGRGPRLRDRPGPPRPRAASTTACAPSAPPSARWS
jgi:acyl-CoA dehydrogenase